MQVRLWYHYAIMILALTSCQTLVKPPLGKELTRKDFAVLTQPIPEVLPVVRQASTPAIAIPQRYQQKLSVYISPEVSLGSLLEKIAALLNIDLQIDNALYDTKCGITFSATNQPFIDVLENICNVGKMRYRISRGVLFIEKDTPFTRSYNVQFLNLTRLSENRISSATDIFSNSINHNAETGNVTSSIPLGENGSNTSVLMNSENNFWKELEVNLKTLLQPDSSPVKPYFTIHKQAGIISVFGTSEHHNCIKTYLNALKKSVSSQILIEAKVIEVALREEFKSGIDWGRLKATASGTASEHQIYGGGNMTGVIGEANIPNGFFQYTAQFENGLYGFIQALQRFGTTKTLSSPRITVMNNQSAILKVARNHVYFKLNYNKHFYTKSAQGDISVGSDIQTVPIGLVMSVQPAIDLSTNSVILFLRPTISKLAGTASDPSVSIANNTNDSKNKSLPPESKIPIIEVKEIDSVLRLKDGEVAVLGGLMETSSTSSQNKAPLLGDVPILKEAFSGVDKEDHVTEVVILIKVKILDSVMPDAADERLVHLYSNDPRPIF